MKATFPKLSKRSRDSRLLTLGPLVLALIAILWGAYESLEQAPRAGESPPDLSWVQRYEVLREPLREVGAAIYFNEPDSKGKTRFFMAQYILTPTTLFLKRRPSRLLAGGWPEQTLVFDFWRDSDLAPVVAELQRQAGVLEIEVERLGGGLAVVRRRPD